jgi:4'-phosphopantetheinyl transferase
MAALGPGTLKPTQPGKNSIELWQVDLTDASLDGFSGLLAEDERLRAEKFAFDADRERLVRSRVALRSILSECLGCQADQVVFRYNQHSKPELASSHHSDLEFNLTHSGSVALIAVAKACRVGVDVDRVGRTTAWQAIAKRSFSVAEMLAFQRLPEAVRELAFYRTWTQKEAYTKALGDGFSYGFKNFTVAVNAQGSAGLLAEDKQPQSLPDWTISFVDSEPGLVAAVAHDGAASTNIRISKFSLKAPNHH